MTRTGIAISSLWSRRVAVGLTVVGIALSVAMILGVDRVRLETRENFASTVSGTDLIVGARTSPVQLLLYSVFRIGDATANIGYASYLKISSHPSVAWAVPLSLGDSHRGYRVVGTTPEFFDHIRYGRGDGLHIGRGEGMRDRFDAIIGAEVAETLGYAPNDAIVIAHGARDDGLARHESLLFAVAGILDRTGTPVDRSIHVTLEGIEAIHVGWESGVRIADQELHGEEAFSRSFQPETITAFYLGLERRSDALQIHRAINAFPDEPLLAILPGVALTELWSLFSTAELALVGVAGMAMITGLIGMIVGLFSTLNERRREMAVLRSVGARPLDVFTLFIMESTLIGGLGAIGGYLLLSGAILVANPLLGSEFGLQFSSGLPGGREGLLLLLVIGLAFVTGMLPAWQAYRLSLQDGLNAGG
jgi:putative ABC transport system permease protein